MDLDFNRGGNTTRRQVSRWSQAYVSTAFVTVQSAFANYCDRVELELDKSRHSETCSGPSRGPIRQHRQAATITANSPNFKLVPCQHKQSGMETILFGQLHEAI